MKRDNYKPYLLSAEKEKSLWENGIIVFDSSALLDFYFIPKRSRSSVYSDIFEKLPNRLWIPFHVQFEYMKNRENTIVKPIGENYDPLKKKIQEFAGIATSDFLRKIEEIERVSKKDDKHPCIDQTAINEFHKGIKDFIVQIKKFEENALKDVENATKEISVLKDDDDVLEAIEKYFAIGRDFSFEEILEITKEGKHRYEFKIPPGYGDLLSKEKKGTQIFGDLIIWKQILEFSKEVGKSILFVTNDIKKDEDWCYLDKNATEVRIHAPREELIKEIRDFSDVDFWMLNLPQFLYHANKYLKSSIKDEVIQNISQLLNTKEKRGKFLKFKCKTCGKIHKFHKFDLDLDFDLVSSEDRNMGKENEYFAEEYFECNCGNEISVKFEVWEYPRGAHNYDSIEIDGAELIESFNFTVDFFGSEDKDSFYLCQLCDGNNDGWGNNVDFHTNIELENRLNKSNRSHKYDSAKCGHCNWCNALHIKCPRCKEIIAFPDGDATELCWQCGFKFQQNVTYDKDCIESVSVTLLGQEEEE